MVLKSCATGGLSTIYKDYEEQSRTRKRGPHVWRFGVAIRRKVAKLQCKSLLATCLALWMYQSKRLQVYLRSGKYTNDYVVEKDSNHGQFDFHGSRFAKLSLASKYVQKQRSKLQMRLLRHKEKKQRTQISTPLCGAEQTLAHCQEMQF